MQQLTLLSDINREDSDHKPSKALTHVSQDLMGLALVRDCLIRTVRVLEHHFVSGGNRIIGQDYITEGIRNTPKGGEATEGSAISASEAHQVQQVLWVTRGMVQRLIEGETKALETLVKQVSREVQCHGHDRVFLSNIETQVGEIRQQVDSLGPLTTSLAGIDHGASDLKAAVTSTQLLGKVASHLKSLLSHFVLHRDGK